MDRSRINEDFRANQRGLRTWTLYLIHVRSTWNQCPILEESLYNPRGISVDDPQKLFVALAEDSRSFVAKHDEKMPAKKNLESTGKILQGQIEVFVVVMVTNMENNRTEC
ncbi:unnamed protein product [Trichogramma brassicae]|uniref:Uncharacterized protein n=1 Tax=Trichogramma brassicae TaxID=86971 RepID=A0A6H5ICI6_9HYME|nr:unnamed protein product [Trichogramma brassicae]